MSMKRDPKIESGAPCVYMCFNEAKQKDELTVPAVDCDRRCWCCGWNPEEKKRRFKSGEFVKNGKVNTLHFKKAKEDTMKTKTRGWYNFADGYRCWYGGLSPQEKMAAIRTHGKILKFEPTV